MNRSDNRPEPRPRSFPPFGAMTVMTVIAVAGTLVGYSGLFDFGGVDRSQWAGTALIAVATFVVVRVQFATVRRHNRGIAAMNAGRDDEAFAALSPLARGLRGRWVTALASNSLAELALMRGAFDEAVAHARHGLRYAPAKSDVHDLVETQLALSLVCAGSLDEAASHAARVERDDASAKTRASIALVRALASFRAGRHDDATAALTASRTLIRNALTGWRAGLVEAMEADAAARVGGAYRGGSATATGIPYSTKTRGIVAKILPGAEARLAALA
jgi:hypothetical protein